MLSELTQSSMEGVEAPLNVNPDAVLAIMYSSGSTGFPKGVQLTHRNIIAQVVSCCCSVQPCSLAATAAYGMTELTGCISFSTPQLDDVKSVGRPLPFNDVKVVHPESRQTLGPNEQGEICVRGPNAFKGYLKNEIKTSEAYENGFRGSGSYFSSADRLGRPNIYFSKWNVIWLTYCVGESVNLWLLKMTGDLFLLPEPAIFDRRNYAPALVSNKLLGRAPLGGPRKIVQIANGYWNFMPFPNAGDIGYYSSDGRIFVCGRLKELIKCMDQQVAPAELEELLAADPDVLQVIVVGVPHPHYGEAPRAFVVPRRRLAGPNEEEREADRLKELVAANLANHKHLYGGVQFMDCLPQTGSYKDSRSALKELYIKQNRCANN
ncbi:luciferin 4-monooxygenase-like [Dermacentor andersoni]|uniref:luciferin 4-monooxygenase-like n=1 Tax=Dermacentor andersoni TaxID=34620 RepID=UPI003B3B3402